MSIGAISPERVIFDRSSQAVPVGPCPLAPESRPDAGRERVGEPKNERDELKKERDELKRKNGILQKEKMER
jgi:hypothetical protein